MEHTYVNILLYIPGDVFTPLRTPSEGAASPAPGSEGFGTGEPHLRHRGTPPSPVSEKPEISTSHRLVNKNQKASARRVARRLILYGKNLRRHIQGQTKAVGPVRAARHTVTM
ncbi:hypothetical protein [Bacteroides rodentium]